MKTVTYDETQWKLVPVDCTNEQAETIAHLAGCGGGIAENIYYWAIKKAPAYPAESQGQQEKSRD